MSIRIIMTQLLREGAKSSGTVEVNGSTVGDCLDDLIRQYPDTKRWLFDRNGILLVLIRINDATIIRSREKLTRPVNEGDELYLFTALGGG